MPRSFNSLNLIQEMKMKGSNLDLEAQKHLKSLFVGWHNIELLATPLSKIAFAYVVTPAFWFDLESLS